MEPRCVCRRGIGALRRVPYAPQPRTGTRQPSQIFRGAVAAGWRAFNINGDRATGIGAWSDEDLEQYLSVGHAQRHGTAAGSMGEAVDASLRHLSKSDIHAMITYLRSIPAISTPGLVPKFEPAPAAPKLGVAENVDSRGKHIFEGACAACHDWTGGAGALTPFATLTGAAAVNDPSAILNVVQIVLNGMRRPTLGATAVMPAFGDAYSDSEIAAVANYVTGRVWFRALKCDERPGGRFETPERELTAWRQPRAPSRSFVHVL